MVYNGFTLLQFDLVFSRKYFGKANLHDKGYQFLSCNINNTFLDFLPKIYLRQKIGLRLSRGSKSYQTVKHGEEAEFKLMHEEDFYMLLKSDTEGNYSLQASFRFFFNTKFKF